MPSLIPPGRIPQKGLRPISAGFGTSAPVEPVRVRCPSCGHEKWGRHSNLPGVLLCVCCRAPLPGNASAWHQVAEFLDARWLASMGARRTSERTAREGPAGGRGPGAVREVLRLAA